MSKERDLALLRVLAAVAWADGQMTEEESTFLHGLAVEYGLGAQERDQFDAMLSEPASLEDFERYVEEFRSQVSSPEEERRLLDRAERLISADGARHVSEGRYLDLIREWLEDEESHLGAPDAGASFFGRLKKVLGLADGTRPSVGSMARDLAGKVRGDEGASIAAERAEYITLFGALLYRVVYADHVIHPEEASHLRRVLEERFDFAGGEVDYVLRVIQQRVADDLDRQRLCAEFNRITTMEDRWQLVDALFRLAADDGEVTAEELREIRLISNYLWVEPQEFARLRREAGC